MSLPSLLLSIITDVLAPILMMVGIGAFIRYKFKLDLGTLAKLNLWVFGPAFVFDKVANSTLPWSAMGGIVLVTALQVAALGAIVYLIGRATHAQPQTLSAIALATMFYNAGNYGIPLAELAYPARLGEKDGAAVQAFVVLCQNLLNFTLGMYLATRHQPGRSGMAGIIKSIFTLPAVPVVIVALLARSYLQADPSHHLPLVISKTTSYLSLALVPIALITLGAQLVSGWRWPRWRPVGTVLVLRLLLGPILMAAILYGLHLTGWLDLWPWPAELLIITAAVPTAVNTLLLTIETNGDTELAADCVFWTTLFSPITLTVTIASVRLWFG